LIKCGLEITPYYIFLEGCNLTNPPEIKSNPGDYSVKLLRSEDMKILSEIDPGFSESDLINQLDNGQKCIGVKYKGDIIAYMWMNFYRLNYKATDIKLSYNEAYLWNMYTMESHRGKNIAPFIRYKSYELLKEMGKNVIYSISDSFNSPAIKFKKKLNAEKIKLILYIKFFRNKGRSYTLKKYKNNLSV